jgi:hypothetical protein
MKGSFVLNATEYDVWLQLFWEALRRADGEEGGA